MKACQRVKTLGFFNIVPINFLSKAVALITGPAIKGKLKRGAIF